jgi:hypothetical protein
VAGTGALTGTVGIVTGDAYIESTATLNVGTLTSSTAPTEADTYTVVAAFAGSTDYASASAQTTFTISKADASIVVNGYTGVYDSTATPTRPRGRPRA